MWGGKMFRGSQDSIKFSLRQSHPSWGHWRRRSTGVGGRLLGNQLPYLALIACHLRLFVLYNIHRILWEISLRQVNKWSIQRKIVRWDEASAESSGLFFFVLITSSPVSGKFLLYIQTKIDHWSISVSIGSFGRVIYRWEEYIIW